MDVHDHETYLKYVDYIENLKTDQIHQYYFRGLSNSDYELKTSIARFLIENNLTFQDYIDFLPTVQFYLCSEFQDFKKIDSNEKKAGFFSFIQHHGFPTPLMDWSLSPYIALYFAYRNPSMSERSAIYLFDYVSFIGDHSQDFDLFQSDEFCTVLHPPPDTSNPRVLKQQGTFVITNITDDLVTPGQDYLEKHTLPNSERDDCLTFLNRMGINEMTLFPGADGICSTMKTILSSSDKNYLEHFKRIYHFK